MSTASGAPAGIVADELPAGCVPRWKPMPMQLTTALRARVVASAGVSAGSSGVSSSRGSIRPACRRASISPASKPRVARSRPSSESSPTSSASRSRSQPARSASLLSARTYARLCAWVRWPSSITGTRVEPELARRQQPAVPSDHPVLAIDEHGVGEAELADRAGDQRQLLLRMRPGIACIDDQTRDRPVLEPETEAGLQVTPRPCRLRSWSSDFRGSERTHPRQHLVSFEFHGLARPQIAAIPPCQYRACGRRTPLKTLALL